MRKVTLSLFLAIASIVSAWANVVAVNENFETGFPTSASTVESTVTVASGVWTIKSVSAKSDNGSIRASLASTGYLIAPTVNQAALVTFYHRSGGNGQKITVEKSVDGGAWVSIGVATTSSSSTYLMSSMPIGEAGSLNVRIRFTANNSVFIDDVKIEASEMPMEPSTGATLSSSNVTGSTATINITAGNGDGRTLIYRKGAAVDFVPVDGTSYPNNAYADANNFIVNSGTEASLNLTGFEAGETYYYSVFEYNGNGENRNYKTSSAGTLTVTMQQVPSISTSVGSINFGSVKVGNIEKRELTISGKYFSPAAGDITVTGTALFQVSLSSASGFANSVTVPYTANTLSAVKIYIQYAPTAYQTDVANLTLSGGSAPTQTVKLSGIGSNTDVKVYYISPSGDDANAGSYDAPLKNLQVAVDKMVPGDTLYVRGGTYYPTTKKDGLVTTVRLTVKGSADKMYTIKAYPGELPIINFKDQPKELGIRGIFLGGDYFHIYGLHITEAGDNGIKIEGNHNCIERCTLSYNDDSGIQIGFGHDFNATWPGVGDNDGTYCCYNDIIDCDSYLNFDLDSNGGDADGFACKMHNGLNNRFIRCRAWDNSDDAWDLYETDYPVYLIECWAWGSGRAANFTPIHGSFAGNGNGIKMGGNGTGGSSKGKHEAWNCIAFNCNTSSSVKGFDQNSHKGGIKLVNCLGFGNGYDFMFETADGVREFHNNVCFGSIELAAGAVQGKNAQISTTANGFTNIVCNNFSASDYNSLSEDDAKKPRSADGKLPTTFGQLKSTSKLIDLGDVMVNDNPNIADLELRTGFSGATRDLGPYEYNYTVGIAPSVMITNSSKLSLSSTNPMDTEGYVSFSVAESDFATVEIYTLQGQKVMEVFSGAVYNKANYDYPVNASELKNGIYLVVLKANNEVKTAKFIVKH